MDILFIYKRSKFYVILTYLGHSVVQFVEGLRYKPEGWCSIPDGVSALT
jgi:hypothetical protein